MVIRMAHRGAEQAHKDDGDGVGIMISIPDDYFRAACSFQLPAAEEYGVANIFLPQQVEKREDSMALVERVCESLSLKVLGWRAPLPVNSSVLGPYALATEPYIAQVFIGEQNQVNYASAAESCDDIDMPTLERQRSPNGTRRRPKTRKRHSTVVDANIRKISLEARLFLARRAISLRARELFICSMNSRTITYKGQFKPDQLFEYYLDLKSEQCTAFLAVVHSRFSTNSFPSWNRAHPFRRIAHNGEINTLEGNRNQVCAREALMFAGASGAFGGMKLEKYFPVDEDVGSDSALLDNIVELLLAAGNRDLAEVIMMVIPEAWQNAENMEPEKRAFYKYNSCMMEPWDGPALVAFTDGLQFGATLDRNGLRPGRFYITRDEHLILASEVGVVDVPPEQVEFKGRLRPGKMLLVDFEKGCMIDDAELKMRYAQRLPYEQYLKEHSLELKELLGPPIEGDAPLLEELLDEEAVDPEDPLLMQRLLPLLRYFGYTHEKLDMLISPMVKSGHEPLGSMGQDTPLACLSKMPRMAFDYFSQLFAQATNPPIDPIREANVMSLVCPIGPERNLLDPAPESCRRIFLDSPVLCPRRFNALLSLGQRGYPYAVFDMTYSLNEGSSRVRSDRAISKRSLLRERLDQICREVEVAIRGDSVAVAVLTHRMAGEDRIPINSLLVVGALHQYLVSAGLRAKVAIVVEAADAFEVHHHCLLLGFGVDAIYPYLCYVSLMRVRGCNLPLAERVQNYRKGAETSILKVMSKMGISCLQSYKGAKLFQAVGLGKEVLAKCFSGCKWVLNGIGFDGFEQDALEFHRLAYPPRGSLPLLVDADVEELPDSGEYHFRSIHDSEIHMNTPDVIYKLQEAVKSNSSEGYKLYSHWQNKLTEQSEIRGQLEFCFDACDPIPIDQVEPASEIVKRFCTGAASLGSISEEAHTAMAIAMNRVGGRSNTGEGGEDPARFLPMKEGTVQAGSANWDIFEGDSMRSKIKQVASGRFGVTAEYLANADEIQIKLAQGAKPGEGGELPGYKVIGKIAETRKATSGVGLISPPPHHDMYSIEDVAQLIMDLKNANPTARISVKLVARIGVGVIASGVVKGKADHLTISGMSGGTGAAKWGSIKHCGLPWEIGVAETHQTLVLNGLRDRVTVQTDGQLRTGRDVIMAALLGAEEVAMTTAPLIALGCIMMRKCHLNTCPVGVATQDPELRKKFTGQPEHLINYYFMVAEETREIMASLGIRKFNELIGRTDLLRPKAHLKDHWKTAELDFTELLRPAWTLQSMSASENPPMYCCAPQDHGLAHVLDNKLVMRAAPALENKKAVSVNDIAVHNVDRSVGGMLSFEITKLYGAKGLPENTIHMQFRGSSGQSFGNFLCPGVTFELEGDANDYIGKGLSGGTLIVYKPTQAPYKGHEAILAGNAALYGATSGKSFMSGVAAERFAVRNSGATAVVEGVGDHGCEYMTRGLVVILGPTGENFAAGMSGGIAYLLDLNKSMCNLESIFLETLEPKDEETVRALLEEHVKLTSSLKAKELLSNWTENKNRLTKVFPKEYKRALAEAEAAEHVPVPTSPEEVPRAASAKDLEDLVQQRGRPSSVLEPQKKKGFHEYERKALSYRDSKDRTLDWEEIYASQPKKSQQWHSWMKTQTARCMDCGTPTCHSPNQGGGGCPLGNRIPTWNQLVHEGEWKRALERLLDTNNFPEFTGTTCPAPCEEACVLGINEDPVAIKTTELSIIEYGFQKGWVKAHAPQVRTRKRISIIGSGPAGLAAAQQLNRAGHRVTIIERADRGGGLLMYGIPSMKLAKHEKVGRRLQLLKEEGIEFKYNTEVGRDVMLADLCAQQDAVILATGATQWRDMRNTEGRQLKNVVQAMDFLTNTQKAVMDLESGKQHGGSRQLGASSHPEDIYGCRDARVIVIGGGDTAADCVATAVRLGAKSVLQFSRRGEAPKERPKHTPWPCWADTYRVDYAHAEVKATIGRDPREYMVATKSFRPSSADPSRVGGVIAAQLGNSGAEAGVVDYPAEIVILAMGFTGPDTAVDPQAMLMRDQNSNFKAAYGEYLAEGSPWKNLFACGDCRRGASLVVTAIAEGRDCAARVDSFLMGDTSLPRAAPLAANPAFYQMPPRGENQPKLRRGLPRRKRGIEFEVSDAFERGLVAEPRIAEEPEAEAEAEAKTTETQEKAALKDSAAPAPAERAADPAAERAAVSAAPAAAASAASASSAVPTWLVASLGGMVALNAALAFALVKTARRQ
eukprot:TRINITY_DN1922_c0_g1_i5.p1 TRINITY_DN1922_c0_g1~~TRINITY_DN1922_c0_g1_i5.p1  ORF type:complete len:2308 (-),score=461.78 TRINITY_DN1922_c0_g1_i5:58-6777(-)